MTLRRPESLLLATLSPLGQDKDLKFGASQAPGHSGGAWEPPGLHPFMAPGHSYPRAWQAPKLTLYHPSGPSPSNITMKYLA